MESEITDVNNLVLFLAATAMQPLLNDEVWQCYGYKRRPRHGNIWNEIFPKMFALENFITKEILTLGLIDVLNGVEKTTESTDTKLLILVGVVDQFLSTTKHLFSSDLFMENLFYTYAAYLTSEKSKIHEPVILKAKDILNEKDFARFMVGTIKLLAIEDDDDFLLRSDYIKGVVEKSSKKNKLKISMTDEAYRKFVPVIEKKILNT